VDACRTAFGNTDSSSSASERTVSVSVSASVGVATSRQFEVLDYWVE